MGLRSTPKAQLLGAHTSNLIIYIYIETKFRTLAGGEAQSPEPLNSGMFLKPSPQAPKRVLSGGGFWALVAKVWDFTTRVQEP